MQASHDNLQRNLNLSQQEVRELEEAGRRLLNSYQIKEKKLNRYKNKLDWERNRTIKLEEDLDTNQEILDQKNYRITRLVEKSKQQLIKEREIARNFFANQRNQFISACELDRINFLTALRNKQNQIRDLEEAGGALLNSFYNKEQELQYNQEDLNELQERLQHSEETLESKNRLIIVLASKLNITEIERENYLNELNELEMNSQEREEVLADKNAKIAQVIAENNNLRNQIDNHTCPPCPLTHLPEPHECPIINKAECSRSDYEELKKQLSQKRKWNFWTNTKRNNSKTK